MEEIDLNKIKEKLSVDPQSLSFWEWGFINFMLDNDRDFIIAPQYDFSLNKAIKEHGPFSRKEVAESMATTVEEIENIEKRGLNKVSKRIKQIKDVDLKSAVGSLIEVCKGEMNKKLDKITEKNTEKCREYATKRKGRKMAKRGMRQFDKNAGLRYLIQMKKKFNLPETFSTNESLEKPMKWWDLKNLENAANACGRMTGSVTNNGTSDVYNIDLSGLPVLRRGRKPKEKTNE